MIGAERRADVTKVGLSGERKIGRSRSAHMLCSRLAVHKLATLIRLCLENVDDMFRRFATIPDRDSEQRATAFIARCIRACETGVK